MNTISILEKTKDFVVLKIPRRFLRDIDLENPALTEPEALRILRSGMAEYRAGKTKILGSLRNLRYGN